jgi:TonB family protein
MFRRILVKSIRRAFSVIAAGILFAPNAIATVGDVIATYAPKPEYPYAARAKGLFGSGVFLLHVRRNGTVKSVDVLKSTGHRILDQAAIAAFRQWRFRTDAEYAPLAKVPITFTTSGIPPESKFVDDPKR